MQLAQLLINDPDPAVRREVAVALRDLDPEEKLPLVVELFRGFDGIDRHYLEACGLAAEDIEAEVWEKLEAETKGAPLAWSEAFTWITWRLKPEAAVPGLIQRVKSGQLNPQAQQFAMESLAFIGNAAAVDAIADLARGKDEVARQARWWLLNRGMDDWAQFGVKDLLKERGIYDPETVVIQAVTVPLAPKTKLPPPRELLKLKGDPVAGKLHAMRCVMCHRIDDQGVDYGPALEGWVANQGKEAFFEAVVSPSQSIAHGFTGSTIFLRGGGSIDGLIYSDSDPVVIASTGGIEQLVPRGRIKGIKKKKKTSLMLSADQLGFSAQQLADLAAYLEIY